MSSSEKLRFHTHLAAEEAAHQLENLARGVRTGAIQIEADDQALDVECASNVRLSVDAKTNEDKRKSRITITLSWRLPEATPAPPHRKISARDDTSLPDVFSDNGASHAASTRREDAGRRALGSDA